MIDLCVVGLGYVGLPTATVFAAAGLHVQGVDLSPHVVASVNSGNPHIFEPALAAALSTVIANGSLKATTEPDPANAFIIAVPTPFSDNYEPDLSYVMSACQAIAPCLSAGGLVVLESTSPIGATELVAQRLSELRPDLHFPTRGDTTETEETVAVAYCPERVLPGRILHEMRHNDRILGGVSPLSADRAATLYRKVVTGECNTTDCRTAELAKLSENAFRDVNIALANELSMVSAEHGIDVQELIRLANRHPRVDILSPGPGVGGHCIAVDPWFIVSASPASSNLIRTAREVNLEKTEWVLRQIAAATSNDSTKSIAILGLSYKPDIDDLRESPALEIAQKLNSAGHSLRVVEPNITSLPAELDGSELVGLDDALAGSDVLVLLVNHAQFSNDAARIAGFEGITIDMSGSYTSPSTPKKTRT